MISHLELLITSGHLRGSEELKTNGIPSAVDLCSCPVCSLPPGWVGSCLHMQQAKEMHFTQSSWQGVLQGSTELTATSSAVTSLHTQWSTRAGVRDWTGVWPGSKGAGRAPALPTWVGLTYHHTSSSGYGFTFHSVLPRKMEEVPLLIFSSSPARCSCSIPVG